MAKPKLDKKVRGRDLLSVEAGKDLQIDPLSLDKNCIEQADLYLKWSERLNVIGNARSGSIGYTQ